MSPSIEADIRRLAEVNATKRGLMDVEAAKTNFRAFTKYHWSVRESSPFQDNWVIGAICEHLTAVYTGEIRKLLINVYFRSLKSNLTSVFFPAWVWGQEPESRFLYMTYAQSLALRDARHTRELFDSRQYKSIFPDSFIITKDSEGYYENDKTGSRISIGSGAQQTGFGAKYKFFDDPNDTNKVESPVDRQSTNMRIDNLSTRSDNFAEDRWVIVQQRTHPKDATGHVKELGLNFEQLVIPLEYDGKKSVTSLGELRDPRTVKGEIADPLRFPPLEVIELKKLLGFRFNGQANQNPTTPEGNAIRKDWYEPFVTIFEPNDIIAVRLAYDVAFTDAEDGNWTWGALKCKRKNAPDGEWQKLTLWQHFGHWNNVERRRSIGEFGSQVKKMMAGLFPNAKWELTLEAGVGAGVDVTKADISYLQGLGLPAKTVQPKKQAKPVRAIAYLSSCQGGFTKFYNGIQLNDYFISNKVNGTEEWILRFYEVTLPLLYSDDGLEFINGNDDPIDGEVMADDGLDGPKKTSGRSFLS